MGKRGPKPQDPEIKRLRGNPGKKPISENENNPDNPGSDVSSGDLHLPQGLTQHQQDVWRRVRDAMPGWWFTAADRDALIEYCRLKVQLDQCAKSLTRQSIIVTRANGSKCRNPLLDVQQGLRKDLLKYREALGLDRQSRKGLVRPGPGDEVPGSHEDGDDPDSEFGNLIPMHLTARRE